MGRVTRLAALSLSCLLAVGCGGDAGDDDPTEPRQPVDSVAVSPPTADVDSGGTTAFTATAFDILGEEIDDATFTWSSSDEAVATVEPSGPFQAEGVVTGMSAGRATIRAQSGDAAGTAEVTVLNRAGGTGRLAGRVIDAVTELGISGARLRFFLLSDGSPLGDTETGADGSYLSPPLPFTSNLIGDVSVNASAAGYVSTNLLQKLVDDTTIAETIPLVPESPTPGGLSGTVTNARNEARVLGASVRLVEGMNAFAAPIATTTTDANGFYQFSGVSAGTYTLYVTATGFAEGSRTGIVVGNNEVRPGQDIALSPEGNEIRIVLTWGASPADLDSHLTGWNPDGTPFHVYYSSEGNLDAPPFAALDDDDVDSYGPETITITQLNVSLADGRFYRYSVHDYTNRNSPGSSGLRGSGAKVEVYAGNTLRERFFVPSQPGTLWTVFEITSGDLANPLILPKNTMSDVSDPGAVPRRESGVTALGASDTKRIGAAVRARPKPQRR
jgi:hypothetical protein